MTQPPEENGVRPSVSNALGFETPCIVCGHAALLHDVQRCTGGNIGEPPCPCEGFRQEKTMREPTDQDIEQKDLDRVYEKIWKTRDHNKELIESWYDERSSEILGILTKQLQGRSNAGNHFGMSLIILDYDNYVKSLLADEEWLRDVTLNDMKGIYYTMLDESLEGRL